MVHAKTLTPLCATLGQLCNDGGLDHILRNQPDAENEAAGAGNTPHTLGDSIVDCLIYILDSVSSLSPFGEHYAREVGICVLISR
jgi:hypothetical protein